MSIIPLFLLLVNSFSPIALDRLMEEGGGILPSGDSGHFGLLPACLYEELLPEPAKATSGGGKKGHCENV